MKKYNNYKKYYESHKEQEKQRYLAYYYANREKILAQRREKRKNMPKKVKLTPTDYEFLWKNLLCVAEWKYTEIALLMHKFENDRLEKKKEMLKDVKN